MLLIKHSFIVHVSLLKSLILLPDNVYLTLFITNGVDAVGNPHADARITSLKLQIHFALDTTYL